MPTRTPKLPPRRPQSERRHYVFLDRCGCPFGVAEETDHCKTEDDAWDMLYDTRAEERAARAQGVRVEYVDQAAYERNFYELMKSGCKHR